MCVLNDIPDIAVNFLSDIVALINYVPDIDMP